MKINQYFIMYLTLSSQEIKRIIRIWPQTLLPSAVTTSLYLLVFGQIVGLQIGKISNVPFIDFITPGLATMVIINNSYLNVVVSFYGARFHKSIEGLLVSPMNNHIIIMGYVTGGVFRGLISGTIVVVISCFFANAFRFYSLFLIFISFFILSFLFSLGGLINGIFSEKFDDTMIFSTFILTPLVYLGGVFFDINLLPLFWRTLSKFNPLLYIIDFMRYSFLGSSLYSPTNTIFFSICLLLILYIISFVLLEKGFRLKN